MSEIKAIETEYNGYRFRSRLEARWAVFFDALGVKYEYEKEGYELGDAGRYLPDFWMPAQKCWVEIKGGEPTGDEIKKARILNQCTDYPVFIFSGLPTVGALAISHYMEVSGSGGGYSSSLEGFDPGRWAYCFESNRFIIRVPCRTKILPDGMPEWRGAVGPDWEPWCDCDCDLCAAMAHPVLAAACDNAKQARFEHGEKGGL